MLTRPVVALLVFLLRRTLYRHLVEPSRCRLEFYFSFISTERDSIILILAQSSIDGVFLSHLSLSLSPFSPSNSRSDLVSEPDSS